MAKKTHCSCGRRFLMFPVQPSGDCVACDPPAKRKPKSMVGGAVTSENSSIEAAAFEEKAPKPKAKPRKKATRKKVAKKK